MRSLLGTLAIAIPLLLLPAKGIAQSSVVGTWTVTIDSPDGVSEFPAAITQDGTTLNVSVPPGPEPQLTFEGTLEGQDVQFYFEIDYQGMNLPITLTGTVTESRMDGSADFGGMAQGTWSAEKAED